METHYESDISGIPVVHNSVKIRFLRCPLCLLTFDKKFRWVHLILSIYHQPHYYTSFIVSFLSTLLKKYTMIFITGVVCMLVLFPVSRGLNNGLGRTPQMGIKHLFSNKNEHSWIFVYLKGGTVGIIFVAISMKQLFDRLQMWLLVVDLQKQDTNMVCNLLNFLIAINWLYFSQSRWLLG